VPRALVITNPAAARTKPKTVREVRDVLRRGGWQAEVVATGGTGDAQRLAAEAVAEGMDAVAVFGGDGTTMQAASSLVGTDVALALIPGGTGNLLAGNLRIPFTPARAAEILVGGNSRRLDLGRLESSGAHHYFAVACGAGFDAQIMAETSSAQKQRWGVGAYIATSLRLINEMRSHRYHIRVDGVEYEANAAMVMIANCAEVLPPILQFGEGVRPDDGLLDVVVLRADGLADGVQAIWHFLRRAEGPGSRVGHVRGAEIHVETDAVVPVELDGDLGGMTPFTATVVPGAIRVMVPAAP
jgi:YegS/Rv2252/BmrU family lipid kinase